MSASFVYFVPNKPVLNRFLHSPDGRVGRYLSKRSAIVMAAAKRQVGARTGVLRASIHMRHLRDSRGQYVRVGSIHPRALIHHEGTRPRVIVPERQQILRFTNRGRIVYAHSVMHPGTKPNKYLTDNLRLAV